MSKLTANEIYASLIGAGFSAAQATTMTAISLAESGGDDSAVGDVSLQNNTWGPSYGLFQIRTLKGETGRGTDRDINNLAGNDQAQALAAFRISGSGTDFTPWSVYTSGKYRDFLGQAQEAATTIKNADWEDYLPWNLPGKVAGTVADMAVQGARWIAIEALALGLGLGLVGVGVARLVEPRLKRAVESANAKIGKAKSLATDVLI